MFFLEDKPFDAYKIVYGLRMNIQTAKVEAEKHDEEANYLLISAGRLLRWAIAYPVILNLSSYNISGKYIFLNKYFYADDAWRAME